MPVAAKRKRRSLLGSMLRRKPQFGSAAKPPTKERIK